jgi:uncharacterized metal-binding protein
MINCSNCKSNTCYQGNQCAKGYDFETFIIDSKDKYENSENKSILEVSTKTEGEHYMKWTRLEEIIDFAKQMKYKKIGIAHCIGLINETKQLKEILDKDFSVSAICCKFSGISKKDFNLTQIDNNRHEAICNSIGQALVLNDLKTDLNIIVGLCVGHDILFTKYSEAPVTTFIVKDRITGHNPVVTLNSNYYKNKFLNR